MPRNIGYAAPNANAPLAPMEFDRRAVGAEDVRIEIAYCGICHSDIHQARDEFGGALATTYPNMPGHEIAGTVVEVGDSVTAYAVGDRVGVGCLVYWGDESQRGVLEEQYQMPPAVFTYNGQDPETGEVTLGGYSDEIVVNEHFVLRIPDSLSLADAAPLLCAGVTTWAPLERFEVGEGSRVGVVGIGGLGHLAVKLAKARGAEKVIAITSHEDKVAAVRELGADDVIVVSDEDAMATHAGSLDIVISTIPTPFDMNPYLGLLGLDGTFVSVGMLEPVEARSIDYSTVVMKRLTLSGSLIGNIAETQQVLDFCGEHGIAADVEVIPASQINEAFDKVVAGDARFRYVIDNSTLRASA